jgi:hypothetical protein
MPLCEKVNCLKQCQHHKRENNYVHDGTNRSEQSSIPLDMASSGEFFENESGTRNHQPAALSARRNRPYLRQSWTDFEQRFDPPRAFNAGQAKRSNFWGSNKRSKCGAFLFETVDGVHVNGLHSA